MKKAAWRKIYDLPPGYIQEPLFPDKPQARSGASSVLIHFFGTIFVILLFVLYLTQQIYLSNLGRSIAETEKQLSNVHRENEALRLAYTQAENLQTIEKIAIDKLGMIPAREIYYIKPIEFASR